MIENYDEWLKYKNIILSKTQIEKLNHFAESVLKWNKKINLTAAKSLKEITERHILDSLMPLTIGFRHERRVVDLGSGGGFPAIPLAITCPNTRFLLIEKVLKKCAFLNKIKRELNLKNIEIENTLIEEINTPLPQTLITRAVKIDGKMEKILKNKGIIRIFTFNSAKPEIFSAIMEYTLPSEGKARYITKREVK